MTVVCFAVSFALCVLPMTFGVLCVLPMTFGCTCAEGHRSLFNSCQEQKIYVSSEELFYSCQEQKVYITEAVLQVHGMAGAGVCEGGLLP